MGATVDGKGQTKVRETTPGGSVDVSVRTDTPGGESSKGKGINIEGPNSYGKKK